MKFDIKCDYKVCNTIYHITKLGYQHLPFSIFEPEIEISSTKLFYQDKILQSQCPKCGKINKIELDDEQIAIYILYTSNLNTNNNIDQRKIEEILTNIRHRCYGVVTKESIKDLHNLIEQLQTFHNLEITNPSLDFKISINDFFKYIELIENNLKNKLKISISSEEAG